MYYFSFVECKKLLAKSLSWLFLYVVLLCHDQIPWHFVSYFVPYSYVCSCLKLTIVNKVWKKGLSSCSITMPPSDTSDDLAHQGSSNTIQRQYFHSLTPANSGSWKSFNQAFVWLFIGHRIFYTTQCWFFSWRKEIFFCFFYCWVCCGHIFLIGVKH